MSNVDNTDVNSISLDAFARAQQYHAAAIARWLGDVIVSLPTVDDSPSPTLNLMRRVLHGVAEEMDAGRLAVPEVFR